MLKKTLLPLVIFFYDPLASNGLSQPALILSSVLTAPYPLVPRGQLKNWVVMKRLIALLMFIFMTGSLMAQATSSESTKLLLQLSKSKPDSNQILTLIKLVDYYAYATDVPNNLDSADFYLAQALKLNKDCRVTKFQNNINILSADIFCTRKHGKDARTIFIPVINACKKSGDKQNECLAWEYLANKIELNDKSDPYILTCDQNALSLSLQLNNGEDEMYWRRAIADFYLKQRKFDLAESEMFQILKDQKKTGAGNLMLSYDLLTSLFTTKGEYDKALLYALKAEKTMEATGDSSNAIVYYGRLVNIYMVLGNPSLSNEWARKALNNAILTKDFVTLFKIMNSIVVNLIREGRGREALKFILETTKKYKPSTLEAKRLVQRELGDSYNAIKKYDLAEKSYLEMISLGNNDKATYSVAEKGSDNHSVGNFFLNRKKYSKAKTYLTEALVEYKETGNTNYLKEIYLSLFRLDSAMGNYQAAIKYLRLNNTIKDSIFNISKNKQIEELQIAYKTEEKEKDNRLLKGTEKLDQTQLQQAKNTRNWTIAGSCMLLIIAGLLYRQNSQRKKNNAVITHKNELLQHLLTEKEWLLKEVHHRVKNNLHTVICLLESQAAYLENDALKAIENSQHRIYAMSLIHQKLYQSDDIKTIDMAEYIPELVKYLEDSFDVLDQIEFRLNIDPVSLNISHAIPLGLIINEAVSNSIKYAFPGKRKGQISISLVDAGTQITLVLADNGIGMPLNTNDTESTSLGLELIKGLSEDIEGAIRFEVSNGTQITIMFRPAAHDEQESFPTSLSTKGVIA